MYNVRLVLKKILYFYKFFVESETDKQKKVLLQNITQRQLRALSEVFNHLLTKYCKLDYWKKMVKKKGWYFQASCDKG